MHGRYYMYFLYETIVNGPNGPECFLIFKIICGVKISLSFYNY